LWRLLADSSFLDCLPLIVGFLVSVFGLGYGVFNDLRKGLAAALGIFGVLFLIPALLAI